MATDPSNPILSVYQHLKADTGEIFYVGKGMGRRAFDKFHRSNYWKRIEAKHGVRVEFIKQAITELESIQLEIQTIYTYRRAGLDLINMTDGGDGTTGYSHTEDHRKKMSDLQTGANNPRFGKPGTRKGAKATEEQIERMRRSHLGKELPEEQRRKIRESTKLARQGIKTLGMTGQIHSEDTKEKMRQKALGRRLPQESIERMARTKRIASVEPQDLLMAQARKGIV